MTLAEELLALTKSEACPIALRAAFQERIKQGSLTREEDSVSHTIVDFLPFNVQTKKIFVVHHKKSGRWLVPAGHIDYGESLLQALNREIEEELGIKECFAFLPEPFLFTVSSIDNPNQACRTHFGAWFLLETDGSDFRVNFSEFYEVRWVSFSEARALFVAPSHIAALDKLEALFNK